MQRNLLLLFSLNFMLWGCSIGPKYEPPIVEVPSEWNSDLSEGMQSDPSDSIIWWQALNDPILDSLIERAASQNLDLYIAATRILEARMEEKGGIAELYPHIDGTASYGHAQYNQKMLKEVLGDCSKGGSHDKNINFFEVGFDAEWELDLFGMQKHEISALKAKIEAAQDEYCQIWVTLSAEVAKNYIELRNLQMHLEIIQKNIRAQKDNLQLTQSLIQAGFAGTIDQRQAQRQLSSLAAESPQIELGIHKAIHRLSILLGLIPEELFAELSQPCQLPQVPVQKPVGIPSELLQRRPDIRKAERDLAAATERVGSAMAARFPRLSLTGFIGDLGAMHSDSFTWFSGSEVLAPIFNSKLLKQDVDFNKIKVQQALYEYQKTVLAALEETENAIASFHYEMERNRHLADAYKVSQEAYQLTHTLYKNGLKNYLEVLVVDRSLITAEEAYLQSQADLLYHFISLYKALGGGWDR